MLKGVIKYVDIAEEIKKIIQNNQEYSYSLPSERLLSQHFSVSRGTIRKALEIIKDQGLISSKIGSGSYISVPNQTKNISSIQSLSEFISSSDLNVQVQILDFQKNIILPKDSPVYFIFRDAPVHAYIRLVSIAGHPKWYEHFYFSAELIPDLTETHVISILDYIEQDLGFKLGEYCQTVQIHKPEKTVTDYFQIKAQNLLNIISRVHLQNGQIIQGSIQFFHPDYSVQLTGRR